MKPNALYLLIRPLIFKLTPEQAHASTIFLLRMGGSVPPTSWLIRAMFQAKINGPAVHAFGLTFANPLGMGAGYDKDGLGWRGLACLGFGHIELGTVTPRPQPGNPSPRTFRLVEDQAAINRMGFPNLGVEFLLRRLQGKRPANLVLGVNIGKNKATPLEEVTQDYLTLLRQLAGAADYLAVNVSSPNTPGLRSLQSKKMLEDLLFPLSREREEVAARVGKPVPILVKLAPDLSDAELEDALDVIISAQMDGVIIHNTTISREGLRSPKAVEIGGLSGAPLDRMNQEMVKKVVKLTHARLPVVASGGVMNADAAQARLDAGAVLVQLYTGMIYHGPSLVRDILNSGLK